VSLYGLSALESTSRRRPHVGTTAVGKVIYEASQDDSVWLSTFPKHKRPSAEGWAKLYADLETETFDKVCVEGDWYSFPF
jgi:hypothetical protein